MQVRFDAPKDTELGEHGDCDVAVYATPEGTEKPRLIGGITAQTIVPKPCRFEGTVVGTNGQPLPGAQLVFQIEDAEVPATQPGNVVNATTDANGSFFVTLTPFRHYRVLIEKQGVGKGNVTIQPMCGVCLRLVLGREEAEVADSVCECRLAHP